MATYITRPNGRVNAQVWIKPQPRKAKTFDNMNEARFWAENLERQLRAARDDGFQFSSIPATPSDVLALPRVPASAFGGVYFLFFKDECIYVGKSVNVPARVRSHLMRQVQVQQFDSYSWFECKPADIDHYERYFIRIMRPRFNRRDMPVVQPVVQEDRLSGEDDCETEGF